MELALKILWFAGVLFSIYLWRNEIFSLMNNIDMEKLKVTVQKYFGWFFVNFVFGLLPVFLHMIFEEKMGIQSFSNFLTYGFTLILSSLYLFHSFKQKISLIQGPITHISILILIIIFFVYISFVFQLPGRVAEFFNSNINLTSITFLFVFIILSFFLNYKALKDEIEFTLNKLKLENSSEYNNLFDEYKNR